MSITTKQWNAYVAVLLQHVDPDCLDSGILQRSIIDNPKVAGANFTSFLRNGCRVNIGGLKVTPQPFDPVTFSRLGQGWKIIAEDHDSCNDGLREVDFSQVDFLTGLNEGETSITGEVKLARLKETKRILYGANVFGGLWQDYQGLKENSVLERLYREKKITYLDFFGDVLQPPAGHRCVLCLDRDGARWYWGANRLDFGWRAYHVSAVSQVAS